MRQHIENALARYKPMCEERDVAMTRRRCYERTPITKYGADKIRSPGVSLRRLKRDTWRYKCDRQRSGAKAVFQKIRRCGDAVGGVGSEL